MSALQHYAVYSIDWLDEQPSMIGAWNAEDACDGWCRATEAEGGFSDGYPDRHELRVVAPDGIETRHLVTTEFDPSYYVFTKPVQP